MLASLSDLLDGGYRGAVQVAIVLSSFDELVVLNIGLHGFARLDKVIVATVNLKLSTRSRRVGNTGAEPVGVFRDELVVDAIF